MNYNPILKTIRVLTGTSRSNFLILTIICVLLGVSAVIHDGYTIKTDQLLLVIAGALAAHIGVNALNEYFDFRSGLDYATIKTPFSGGSGSLIKAPEMAKLTLFNAIINIAAVFIISIYFFKLWGFLVLVPVIPGLLSLLLYSTFLIRMPILCLLAPGIGFGMAMVPGTYIALTGTFSPTIAMVSIVPFFLVSNLLLLNQFPDIEADRNFGRKNVIIKYGKKTGIFIYKAFMMFTIFAIILAVMLNIIPKMGLLGTIPVIITLIRMRKIHNYLEKQQQFVPLLGVNVLTVLSTPALIAASLLFK